MKFLATLFLLAISLGCIYLFRQFLKKLSTKAFLFILFFIAAWSIVGAFSQLSSVWSELFSGEEVTNFW